MVGREQHCAQSSFQDWKAFRRITSLGGFSVFFWKKSRAIASCSAQQNIFSSPPAAPLASLKETSYDWLARNSAPSILQDFSHMSRETRKLDTKIYRRHAS